MHALALCKKNNLTVTIYTDSITALAWLRDKHAKTTLGVNAMNPELFDLLKRAEAWLKANTFPNRVVKWETDQWGEIPADYNRK